MPRRSAAIGAYGALALFTITFTTLGILRHEALNSHSYDLAIYDQVIWNLSRGHWFETSLEYYFYNFLGDHLSLGLTLLSPLYWIYSSPWVLIALQPLAMALAGVPVYWWAKQSLGPGAALAVIVSYVLFTPTIYVIAIDFHDIVLAAPLLSFATYFMLKNDIWRFSLFAFPALLVKEEVGLLVCVLGLYWLLGRRQYVLGAGTAVLGLAWAVIAIKLIIPSFNAEGQYYYLGRDTSMGGSQEQFLMNLLLNPSSIFTQVVTPEKTRYILHLLTPLAFIPLLAPGLVTLVLPTLGYLLLRGESPQFLIITQYAAPIVPFLFYATIRGLSRAGSRVWAPALSVALLTASAVGYYYQSPGPLSQGFTPQRYTITARAQAAKDLMSTIPPDAGVVAQSDLVPHLSRRQRVHMFPEVPTYDGIDYILLDPLGNRYPLAHSNESYEKAVAQVMAHPQFRQVAEREGYLLLKRTDDAVVARTAVLDGKVRLHGYTLQTDASVPGRLALSLVWEAIAPMTDDYSLFVHVADEQGRRLAQWDGPPLGSHLPTSKWQTGLRQRGTYALSIPADAVTRRYQLQVGLYDWKTLERLPVSDPTGNSQDNSVLIVAAAMEPSS